MSNDLFYKPPRRKFSAQYWFECELCPAKQFIYAIDQADAEAEVCRAGWSVQPARCPKCRRSLHEFPPDEWFILFVLCEDCGRLEFIEAEAEEICCHIKVHSDWTYRKVNRFGGTYPDPFLADICPDCST